MKDRIRDLDLQAKKLANKLSKIPGDSLLKYSEEELNSFISALEMGSDDHGVLIDRLLQVLWEKQS